MLRPWERNPRVNDHAVDAVARSIEAFGFNVPILSDQYMTIVAGHTRWKAAQKLGLEKVPVIVVEMTEQQRKAFAVADNKTSEIADWDLPKLRNVLEELRNEDIDLGSLGFTDTDLRRLFFGPDEDDVPIIEDEETVTKIGDLWKLGSHRLICGDSRDRDAVSELVREEHVDFVFGDPPYYNLGDYAQWTDFETYKSDMRQIIRNCHETARDGAVLVWSIGYLAKEHLDLTSRHSALLNDGGFQFLDDIIWVKSDPNFSVLRNAHIVRNRLYYPAFQWEAFLVFKKPGPMPRMTDEGAEYMSEHFSNVWETAPVANGQKTIGHPDPLPVELPYRFLQAYTGRDAVVFDPFGGSGTTMIAAEKAHRRALLMERVPRFCDAAIRRWERFTGEQAVRLRHAGC